MFSSVRNVMEWAAARREDPRDPVAVGERLREAIAAEDATIGTLLGRSAPLDERLANMERLVDEAGRSWREVNGRRINLAFSGGFEARRSDGAFRYSRPRMFDLTELDRQNLLGVLAGLMPEALKEGLAEIIGSDADTATPTREERERLLEAAIARRRELVSEYRALRQAASELDPPVDLPALSDAAEPRLARRGDAEAHS
jgi:hypothetical protein